MTRSAQNKPALGSTNQPQDCASYSASKSSWRPEGATQGLGRHRPVLTDPAGAVRWGEVGPDPREGRGGSVVGGDQHGQIGRAHV